MAKQGLSVSFESASFEGFYLEPAEESQWKQAVADAEQVPAVGQLLDYLHDVGDTYTIEHSERVGRLAAAMAVRMGCSQEIIMDAAISGLVHDVGKYFFQHVIHIDGKLSDSQFDEVKMHAPYGAQMVAAAGFKRSLVHATGNHHGYQGRPYPVYPEALYSTVMVGPLSSSHIIGTGLAAADTFDAMRSVRPGRREPLPLYDALQAVHEMPLPGAVKSAFHGLFDQSVSLNQAA